MATLNFTMPDIYTFWAFLTLGWGEALILVALISILFLGPRMHKLVKGVTRMPLEFLKGKREAPETEKKSGSSK